MKRISIYLVLVLFIALNLLLIKTAKKYEPVFKVENLAVENNQIVPTDILLEFINIKDKNSLADLTAEVIIDRIEKHPYITRAEGRFIDSITYIVRIEEIEPFLLVVSKSGNYILSKDKQLVPEDPRLNILDLPIVTLDFDFSPNEKTKSKIIDKAYNAFNNIYKSDIALFEVISELNINENGDFIFYLTKPRGKILAGNNLDLRKAVYLSEFWRQIILSSPDNQYEYIDLRFNEQIVVKLSNKS